MLGLTSGSVGGGIDAGAGAFQALSEDFVEDLSCAETYKVINIQNTKIFFIQTSLASC
jgi:hypothetical protein